MAPSVITAPVAFASISPGFQDTCALTADGNVYCWGINDGGQLGIDTSTFLSPAPVSMSGNFSFASLNVGTSHACGVSTGGATLCWGFNNRLQLGFDGPDFSFDPVQVSGGLTFTSVVAGYEHSCGLDQGGGAHCWGWNYWGQLGVDSLSAASSPQPVSGGFAFSSIASGMEHSCGLTSAGEAYCWGKSGQYQLGHDPGPFNFQITPVAVSGGLIFTDLAAGWEHTCGITLDGSAYCWGRGWAGQLGDGANLERESPVRVAGGIRFQTISAGWFHTCGLATDGLAYCWGNNTSGQLGSGTPSTNVPTMVLGQPR
jgi:alpha-tubulin suppressor-like RCC1 family protein